MPPNRLLRIIMSGISEMRRAITSIASTLRVLSLKVKLSLRKRRKKYPRRNQRAFTRSQCLP